MGQHAVCGLLRTAFGHRRQYEYGVNANLKSWPTRAWRGPAGAAMLAGVARAELMAYEVDDGRWPLVIVRATAAVNDDSALDGMYRALEAQLSKGLRFVVLLDVRGGTSSPARRRRLLAWAERNTSPLGRSLTALAAVVGNGIERGFVTAVLWSRSPPFPVRVFSDPAEAQAWLMREFEERGAQSP